MLTVVRLTHISIYNVSNPEFIAKAGKTIRQTRGGGIKITISLLECSRFRTTITNHFLKNIKEIPSEGGNKYYANDFNVLWNSSSDVFPRR